MKKNIQPDLLSYLYIWGFKGLNHYDKIPVG